MPEAARADNATPRSHWIILGLILLLGAFLRFYGLAHQSIWWDEAFSIQVAHKGPVEMVQWLKNDVHPPLFYFGLHTWMKLFGSGETAVRAFPALFGFLLLPVLYGVGASLFGRRAGLLTAFVAAVNAFHVRYSQEVRMYTLLPLLGLLSLYFLYKAVSDDKPRYWIGYGLLMTATLYTHNYGAFIAAAGTVFFVITALGRMVKLNWAKFLVVQGLVGLAYLPWLPVVIFRQIGHPGIVGWIPLMRPKHILQTFQMYSGLGFHVFRPALNDVIIFAGGVVFLACFVAGIFSLKKRGRLRLPIPYVPNRSGLALILCYLTVTLGLPMFISLRKPIFLSYRYSIAAWPAFALIVGLGLSKLKKPAVRTAALALILAFSSVSLYWYHCLWVKGYDREITALIESKAGPNDVIIYAPDTRDIPINYYLRSPLKSLGYSSRGAVPRETVDQANALLRAPGAKLFFLVESDMTWIPHLEDLQRLLDERFIKIEQRIFGPTVLTIYAPRPVR